MTAKSNLYYLLFLLLPILLSSPLKAQELEEKSLFKEKVTLMMGLGMEYGGLGFKTKYRLKNNFKAVGILGVLPSSVIWNIGLETHLDTKFSKSVAPYFLVMFGPNAELALTSISGIRERKLIEGFTLGTGIHIGVPKSSSKYYFSAGINYTIISPESANFIEEFNETYFTNYVSNHRRLFLSLGLTFRLWD